MSEALHMQIPKKSIDDTILFKDDIVVKNTIAANLESLPKYIVILPESKSDDVPYYDVVNLLEAILNTDISLTELIEIVNTNLPEQDFDIIDDVVQIYAAKKISEAGDESDQQNLDLIEAVQSFLEYEINEAGYNFLVSKIQYDTVLKKLQTQIEENKQNIKKDQEIFQLLDSEKNTPINTSFVTLKASFICTVSIPGVNIIDLFNSVVLSYKIPFASVDKFFKIYRYFNLPKDWVVAAEDVLFFKIAPPDLVLLPDVEVEYEKYIDLFMYQQDSNPDVYEIEFTLRSETQKIEYKKILENFLSVFDGFELAISTVNASKLSGNYYILSQKLEKYMFAEMAMNDPVISRFLTINEQDLDRKKSNVYLYFRNESVKTSITAKSSKKSKVPLEILNQIPDQSLDISLLRVHISFARSFEDINNFQWVFGRILARYNSLYESTLSTYKNYIPKFKPAFLIAPVEKNERSQVFFKNIDGILFGSNYTSACINKPSLLKEGEVVDVETMVYPKLKVKVPEGEVIPRTYYCKPDSKNIYPGLTLRKDQKYLDELPYYPCCYAKQQSSNLNSLYTKYFYPEKYIEKTKTTQQNLLKTNKFAQHGAYGQLPEDLTRVLRSMVKLSSSTFERRGTRKVPYSFFVSVLEANGALQVESKESQVKTQINRLKERLLQPESIAACKQQTWNLTPSIVADIVQSDSYIDPLVFMPAIEQILQINIYLFDRNGEILIPVNVNGYYKIKRPQWKTVLLYLHSGGTADSAPYPLSELIVLKNNVTGVDTPIFEPTSILSQSVSRVFCVEQQAYTLDRLLVPVVFEIPPSVHIDAQYIDHYGKCRCIWVIIQDIQINLYPLEPLQPQLFKEKTLTELYKNISLSQLERLVSVLPPKGFSIPISTVSSSINTNINTNINSYQTDSPKPETIYLHFLFGEVEMVLCTNYTLELIEYLRITMSQLESTRTDTLKVPDPDLSIDTFYSFKIQKKLARHLEEYVYWFYSVYVSNLESNVKFTDRTVLEFVKKNISIAADGDAWLRSVETLAQFGASIVSRRFTRENGAIIKDGKIIVDTRETRQRLMYLLRLAIRRNKAKLSTYYQKEYMDNYFQDISDMDQYPYQLLLQGENAVENWIDRKEFSTSIYELPNVDFTSLLAYFMSIEGIVYLIQPTSSLQDAIRVGLLWESNGTNIGPKPSFEINYPTTGYTVILHSFYSQSKVLRYIIQNTGDVYRVNILGYLYNNRPRYNAMLQM